MATRRKPSARRRKTLDIDQRLLDDARRALGAETETETVRLALERVANNQRVIEGLRALRGMRFDRRLIDA